MPDLDLDQLSRLPSWITITVIVVLSICLIIGLPLARRAATKAAALARPQEVPSPRRNREKVAMFAALAPTVLVWLAVMGVSFIGLTGFAADTMQWRHWTNLLVPLSLDGISISFGGWAFVAVKRGRHPGRSYRIVLAAAAVSATLNFVHGKDEWSLWAGGYLAFLSLAGMAMFHEMLEQFMADYDDDIALKTRYPRFRRRWLWAPVSTFKAFRAWIVYPPLEATRPTVHNALSNWRRVARLSPAERLDLYDQESARSHGQNNADPRRTHSVSDHVSPLGAAMAAATPAGLDDTDGEGADHGVAEGAARRNGAAHYRTPSVPRPRDAMARSVQPTNAQINAAAEDLWIEFMRQGVDLSGSKLLQEFHSRYPYPRGQRWADYRRKAAQDRLAHADAAVEVPVDATA